MNSGEAEPTNLFIIRCAIFRNIEPIELMNQANHNREIGIHLNISRKLTQTSESEKKAWSCSQMLEFTRQG